MNTKVFENSNKESPIEAIVLGMYGGETGRLATVGDYFLVFKNGEDLKDRIQYDISELDAFLQDQQNKLSSIMVQGVQDYYIGQMAKREGGQALGAANGTWESLAGAAINTASALLEVARGVSSALFGPGEGGRDQSTALPDSSSDRPRPRR